VYEVSSGVRSTRNQDGGIALDIQSGQMFSLNPIGAFVLEAFAKGLDETEIAKEISRQYSISEEIATADVREFLKSLEEHKLLRSTIAAKIS